MSRSRVPVPITLSRPLAGAALALAGLLSITALSACSGTAYGAAADAATTQAATGAGSDAISDTAAPALSVTTTAELGPVVTDADGFTLYRFDKDTADPSTSACAGSCAETWPPALVDAGGDADADADADAAAVGAGIEAADVGVLTRADGTRQLTLAGWPLYRYAPDNAPGDVSGHGVGGTWWASAPTGARAAQEAPAPSVSDGYGY